MSAYLPVRRVADVVVEDKHHDEGKADDEADAFLQNVVVGDPSVPRPFQGHPPRHQRSSAVSSVTAPPGG